MYILRAWQPDPEHPSTEIRCTSFGLTVLTLFPEGRAPSTCWAWIVNTAAMLPLTSKTMGSDLNKDVARQQAEAAAVAFGYQLDELDIEMSKGTTSTFYKLP